VPLTVAEQTRLKLLGLVPGSWVWIDDGGGFNYPDVYAWVVDQLPQTAAAVELGSWLGQSACYFVERVALAQKRVDLTCVDLWAGNILHGFGRGAAADLLPQFKANVQRAGADAWLRTLRLCSWEAAARWADGSVDFVWVDADHSYDGVTKDLQAWWPKVKPGGLIGGHDYHWKQCGAAVDDFFRQRGRQVVPVSASSWMLPLGPQVLSDGLVESGRAQRRRR
jgi:hypothetical protein